MARSVFSSKDLAKLSYEFVPVMAHANTDHPSGEYIVGREKKHLCGIYDISDCKLHEQMVQALSSHHMLNNVSGTPTHIIFNPHDMSEISRAHYMAVKNIEDAIAEAQKQLGKPVRYRSYVKMRETLDEVTGLVKEKDYRGGLRALKHFDSEGMKGMQEEADGLKARILEAGQKRIDEAKEYIEAGEKDAAEKLLKEISREFSGTDLADKARDLKAELK